MHLLSSPLPPACMACYMVNCTFIIVSVNFSLNTPSCRLSTINITPIVWVATHRVYRVSQEEWTKIRESVPYVELYRYNPKHLYPKLNGYGDNGHRKVWASGVSTYCKPSVTPYSSTARARQRDTAS